MSITIPRVMQTAFFNLYQTNGNINRGHARKALKFIAQVVPELVDKIEVLLTEDLLSHRIRVNDVVRSFMEHHTTWIVRDEALYSYGYQVTVGQTLLMDGHLEVEAFELGGSALDPVTHLRRSTNVLEYFNKHHMCDLIQAIECRTSIPAKMYTGLDNMGNNMEL